MIYIYILLAYITFSLFVVGFFHIIQKIEFKFPDSFTKRIGLIKNTIVYQKFISALQYIGVILLIILFLWFQIKSCENKHKTTNNLNLEERDMLDDIYR